MTGDGKRAVEEMAVRIDELNEAAPQLDPVMVARRVFGLVDDLLDELYERAPADLESMSERPSTGYIYERLYDHLRSDEEASEDAERSASERFADTPFTREGERG